MTNYRIQHWTGQQKSISFSLSLFCFVTHGVNDGDTPDQRKTTPCHSQPQQTAAATAFSHTTPDPTVHHVPVIWILVLADVVEKRDKGRKEEEATRKLACIEMFIMLWNGRRAAQVRCNVNSRPVLFHNLWLSLWFSVFIVRCPWQVRPCTLLHCPNPNKLKIHPPCQYVSVWSGGVSWHLLFPKVERYHLELPLAP